MTRDIYEGVVSCVLFIDSVVDIHLSGMNRHHFAVFVHNCRLVLLLRKGPGHGVDLNTFKPAEWRWKLAQVCDGQWHHYAISVDFPEVRDTTDCMQYCTGLTVFMIIRSCS